MESTRLLLQFYLVLTQFCCMLCSYCVFPARIACYLQSIVFCSYCRFTAVLSFAATIACSIAAPLVMHFRVEISLGYRGGSCALWLWRNVCFIGCGGSFALWLAADVNVDVDVKVESLVVLDYVN